MPKHPLIEAARDLSRALAALSFGPPVTHVYDPLTYASSNHAAYLERFGTGTKRVVFLGMNPGPWGMAQTGVPFGEVGFVGGWLGIDHPVAKPRDEHPKRLVEGLACKRSEVSGARLWGAISEHFGTPERFAARHFVANYCPLSFMEQSGRNVTPDKLPKHEREPLYAACDAHLRRVVASLAPRFLIGVGAFAEARARAALGGQGADGIVIGRVLHPSPASPKANRGWRDQVTAELEALGICGAD